MADPKHITAITAAIYRQRAGARWQRVIDGLFRRDISPCGTSASTALELLGLPLRFTARGKRHIPGRLLVIFDDPPDASIVRELLDRGGAVVIEGVAIQTVVDAFESTVETVTLDEGAHRISGPALAPHPAACAPQIWSCPDACTATFDGPAEVLARTDTDEPLVTRLWDGRVRHHGFVTIPYVWSTNSRALISPRELARRAGVEPLEHGLLDRDEPLPEDLMLASLTMISLLAESIIAVLEASERAGASCVS